MRFWAGRLDTSYDMPPTISIDNDFISPESTNSVRSKMTLFKVPDTPVKQDHASIFNEQCDSGTPVNPVNHGEFEEAVNAVLKVASEGDNGSVARCHSLAIQRCRRGGKTFMLAAVAAQLAAKEDAAEKLIVSISMNSSTIYVPGEDARAALCKRIAIVLSGSDPDLFDYNYPNPEHYVGPILKWIANQNSLILLIDELNVIPPDAPSYGQMSSILNNLVGRQGCAVLYSTHFRDTADLLMRGRATNTNTGQKALSRRTHKWLRIPRIENQQCINGLLKGQIASQNSMWCAVLRGRVPCLYLTPADEIQTFADGAFPDAQEVDDLGGITKAQYNTQQHVERIEALKAVITGNIVELPRKRNLFAAFSYVAAAKENGIALYAWPPFMIAQERVLGKNYGTLRATLENPQIEEPKAFEALVELSVLLRLLVNMGHNLVPRNPTINDGDDFQATEYFRPDNSVTDIGSLKRAVYTAFHGKEFAAVKQVVAKPSFGQFPKYDFFVLHRNMDDGWDIVAGYQCKQTKQAIDEGHASDTAVPLSIWIEGHCREYRLDSKRQKVQQSTKHGWTVLDREKQKDLLGVSVWEALPSNVPDEMDARYDNRCVAEQQG